MESFCLCCNERVCRLNDGIHRKMWIKLETKSNRVNGLSFHSKRPWIIASLDCGTIQLWDYRLGILIDTFDGHHGPVRGVHFHNSQPVFVSAGDDKKIIVWNYRLHRSIFTLLGHFGCIRTVQFHHEYPWIVSASDDQTIRIWNWQSQTCISVLTGHTHNVMCAMFHPRKDLLVSASLDKTVRVWDITGLRKKKGVFFGGGDVIVKYVFKGHSEGVTWASFNAYLPLVLSGSDDHELMVWEMRDSGAWQEIHVGCHQKNVSCVLFPRSQYFVSCSEDKRIRVWDGFTLQPLMQFAWEHDRFWILAAHPETNLLAAGHDSGMIVFKVKREHPAFYLSGDSLVYVKDRYICMYDYSTQKQNQLISYRRLRYDTPARTLSYSPSENAVLISFEPTIFYKNKLRGSYELYIISQDSNGKGWWSVVDVKRGSGESAVFIAPDRFAVLEKRTNQLVVKNLKNEIVKELLLPTATDAIFYAGGGNLVCRAKERIVIFHLQQGLVGQLQIPSIRDIVWSPDMASVALRCKKSIVIADKKLVHHCTLHEENCVKSGAWDDNGVFIYTTLTHIKYLLPNGDSGVIKSVQDQLYITKIYGNTIFCLDRDGNNHPITIDSTEYVFKLALLKKRDGEVPRMIMMRNSELCGLPIFVHLHQKGFPKVSLHFVKDEHRRFNLALESGNTEMALESAKKIDEKEDWHRLGMEALGKGNVSIVEYAFEKTKNFGRLSFLHLITGNLDKLSKMMRIAKAKEDVMSQLQNALYIGDVDERVKILENAGHLPLAHVTAVVHGLKHTAKRLAEKMGGNVPSLPKEKKASLLLPPTPILGGGDWPSFKGGRHGDSLDIGEVRNLQNWGITKVVEDEGGQQENSEDGEWDLNPIHETDTPKTALLVIPTSGMPVSQIKFCVATVTTTSVSHPLHYKQQKAGAHPPLRKCHVESWPFRQRLRQINILYP